MEWYKLIFFMKYTKDMPSKHNLHVSIHLLSRLKKVQFSLLCCITNLLTWSYTIILNALSPCFILCQELWYCHFTCLLSIKEYFILSREFISLFDFTLHTVPCILKWPWGRNRRDKNYLIIACDEKNPKISRVSAISH